MVLSKALSWVLRHRAESLGLHVRSDGYVQLSSVLGVDRIRRQGFTAEDVRRVVAANDKQRFSLVVEYDGPDRGPVPVTPSAGIEWIRANQGHSMREGLISDGLLLRELVDPPPVAIHGTTRRAWKAIEVSGLSRMKRRHVHMARTIPAGWRGDEEDDAENGRGGEVKDRVADDKVDDDDAAPPRGATATVSGIRASSEVLIYVDCARAMAEGGLAFFESDNGVILTPGDAHGLIPPAFFAQVRFKALRP